MKKLVTFILGLAFSIPTFCQDAKFEVQVSSDSILLGNYFEIRFIIEDTKGQFEPPSFHELKILSGPNQSSSMQIINGDMNQSMQYSYLLKPEDIGNYIIPPAFLLLEDETTLETESIEIVVVPNPEGIIQKPQLGSEKSFFNHRPSFPFGDGPTVSPEKNSKKKKKKLKVTKI
jgi:hypothetical protein